MDCREQQIDAFVRIVSQLHVHRKTPHRLKSAAAAATPGAATAGAVAATAGAVAATADAATAAVTAAAAAPSHLL